MKTASIIINAVIFTVTTILLLLNFRKDGEWRPESGLKSFRYFTVLSNAFCGVAALVMAVAQLNGAAPRWALLLKFMGTASLAITLLTVLFFLGPTQGFGIMLGGRNFYLHLIGPLLAIGSFCFIEKKGMEMGLGTALLGMLPMIAYGLVYLYKVVLAPERERWEDFYGFTRGGKLPLIFAVMLLGAAAVCIALWKL